MTELAVARLGTIVRLGEALDLEHVSNVQRGGAMSHGTTDGSRIKPQNSLSQSRFAPICCGRWLK